MAAAISTAYSDLFLYSPLLSDEERSAQFLPIPAGFLMSHEFHLYSVGLTCNMGYSYVPANPLLCSKPATDSFRV